MKKIKIHIGYIVTIVLTSLIVSIISLSYTVNKGEFPIWSVMLKHLGWMVFYAIPIYIANSYLYIVLDRKIPFNNVESNVKKFLSGFILGSLINIFVGGILYFLNMLIDGTSFSEAINWVFSVNSFEQIKPLIWISISISITIYFFRYILNDQEEKLKEEKKKVVRITTEHEALKSQIGPHFLFNSLNVLNGLIEENPERAQEFVGDLSSIYRYVLEQKDKPLVSLREELDFAQTYMNLIQKRYEDGLEFKISGEIHPDLKIVPLSLQILLENCIKHNRISSDTPLKVQISVNLNHVLIINNLQRKPKLTESTGKGLQNIIERYKNFTKQKVEITANEQEFKVKLPLLTDNIIAMEVDQIYTKEELKAARKRVEALQDFYWNLTSYIVINLFLTFLDLRDGVYSWAFWPLIGWGIGLAFHAIEVFGFFNTHTWKDKMIQKELARRKREDFRD